MGTQAECVCRYKGRSGRGVAHLETSGLVFRGEFQFNIDYETIMSASGDSGRLSITFSGGNAIFELGEGAAEWAEKINNRPSS